MENRIRNHVRIGNKIRWKPLSPGQSRELCRIGALLVTDDNAFRGKAQRLGAEGCRLHDFAAFLSNALH